MVQGREKEGAPPLGTIIESGKVVFIRTSD